MKQCNDCQDFVPENDIIDGRCSICEDAYLFLINMRGRGDAP